VSGLSIIAAMDRNRVIGKENRLPWRLPADLQRFKALTLGHHVVMGRKTFEAIGRPLPGRTNLLVTHQRNYVAPGAVVVHTLTEALERCSGDAKPFVIGGAEIYRQALPAARRLYLTEVETDVAGGDAFFPAIDSSDWRLVEQEARNPDHDHACAFRWLTYERSR
jgi:dihydrofolate reductase